MTATVAGEEIEINAETCRDIFRGRMTMMGCLINSREKAYKKDGIFSVFPMGIRRYPVLVEGEKLVDITTDAGKWESVYTYILK